MSVDVDSFLAKLEPAQRDMSGTYPGQRVENHPETQEAFAEYERRVDALFGARKCNLVWKHEKPQHRLMLWLRLQGHSNKEIAQITGFHHATVSQVTRQPWFLEAFTRISTEMGKDAVENFLTGETIPTLQKLVELRDTAQSEAVRLSASNSILDRIRGKPTVRVETKNETNINVAVADMAALEEQYQRNQQTLASLGIRGNN